MNGENLMVGLKMMLKPLEMTRNELVQKYLTKEIKVLKIDPDDAREIVHLTDESKMTMDDIIDKLEVPTRGKRKKRASKKKHKG